MTRGLTAPGVSAGSGSPGVRARSPVWASPLGVAGTSVAGAGVAGGGDDADGEGDGSTVAAGSDARPPGPVAGGVAALAPQPAVTLASSSAAASAVPTPVTVERRIPLTHPSWRARDDGAAVMAPRLRPLALIFLPDPGPNKLRRSYRARAGAAGAWAGEMPVEPRTPQVPCNPTGATRGGEVVEEDA